MSLKSLSTAVVILASFIFGTANAATASLTDLDRLAESDSLAFRCITRSLQVYQVSLNESTRLMVVQLPTGSVMEGFVAKTTVGTTKDRHYFFSNGFAEFHYEFMLTLFANGHDVKFELVSGAEKLACSND